MTDALERMRALHSTVKAQAEVQRLRIVQNETHAATETTILKVGSYQNNPIYKIMNEQGKSNQQKIEAIAAFLTTENEDYKSARLRFMEFEAYFNYVQGTSMDLDAAGIEKLIKEVEETVRPQVEKIVKDLAEVQKGAEELDRMREAMQEARLQGKTLDEMQSAIELNDRIIAQIKALEQSIKSLKITQTNAEEEVTHEHAAQVASHEGFVNKIKRVFGEDKEILEAIAQAEARVETIKAEVVRTETAFNEKQAERNTHLESGPLLILRTMDATENSFSDREAQMGRDDLKLISEDKASVDNLLLRVSQRKTSAADIARSVAAAESRMAILQGAVQKSVNAAHEQSEVIKARLAKKNEEVDAATDDVEKSMLNADRMEIAGLQTEALRYEEELQNTIAQFAVVASSNVEAEAAARRYSDLLHGTERMLKRLSNEALPATIRSLRLGLEEDMALQTSELTMSVAAVTAHAKEIGERTRKTVVKTQGVMNEQELQHLEDTAHDLTEAQNMVLEAAEAAINHGRKRSVLTTKVMEATDILQKMLKEFEATSTDAADIHQDVDPGADTGTSGVQRPGAPRGRAAANQPAGAA